MESCALKPSRTSRFTLHQHHSVPPTRQLSLQKPTKPAVDKTHLELVRDASSVFVERPKGSVFDLRTFSPMPAEAEGAIPVLQDNSPSFSCALQRGYTSGSIDLNMVGRGVNGKVYEVRKNGKMFALKAMTVLNADTRSGMFGHGTAVKHNKFVHEIESQRRAAEAGLSVPVVDAFLCAHDPSLRGGGQGRMGEMLKSEW